MKKDKNIDENIVLDEQQKEDEQSQKKMSKDKVKRVVLAVLLLILAVAFVVLGAFCATGLFDCLSAPANVAYADCVVDCFDDENYVDFDIFARNFFGYEDADNVTLPFNAFVIRDDFFSWFDDWGVPQCNRKSFLTFYRFSDDKKVADLLVTRTGNYNGSLILRMFADDKLSSYSSYDMFSFSEVYDEAIQSYDMSVRTFMNSFCFGYGINTVYCKLNDDVVDEMWAIEFTEMMFLCDDVANIGKYNALRSQYDVLQYDYNDLQSQYDALQSDYRCYGDCFTFVPHYYNPSNDSFTVGERMKFPCYQEGVSLLWLLCLDSFDFTLFVEDGELNYFKFFDSNFSEFVTNFSYTDVEHFYNDLNFGVDEHVVKDKFITSGVRKDGYSYIAVLIDGKLMICTDVYIADGSLGALLNDYYNDGLQDGKDEVINTTDVITNGIIDVIESPIEFLKTVFNFEIFGINIASVIFFVISVVIVAFVIKKVV